MNSQYKINAKSISYKTTKLLTRAAALMRESLFANAGYLMGVEVVNILMGFIFWGIAARLYSPKDIGVATAVLAAVALISSVAGMGVGIGLVRFLPEHGYPHRLLNTVFIFTVLVSFLVGGIFLVGLPLWSPSLSILQQNGLYAGGFLVYSATMTLMATVNMVFLARRQTVYQLIYTSIANGGRLLLMLFLVGLGAAGLVGSISLTTILAATLSIVWFLPKVEPGYRPRIQVSRSDLTAIFPYSFGNYLGGLLMQVVQRILPLIILEILGPTSSGHAHIAWMIGSMLATPGIALTASAFAEGANTPQRLPAILTKSALFGILLTGPMAIICAIAAPWLLSIFGPTYAEEGSGLLRWLAIAAPLVLITWIYFTFLRVHKKISRLIWLSNMVAVVSLGIAIVWMPQFGIAANGMGWAVGHGLVTVIAVGEAVKSGQVKKMMKKANFFFKI